MSDHSHLLTTTSFLAMATTKHFALRYLTAVEKKNKEYFTKNDLNIMQCVSVDGDGQMVSVQVIKKDKLPPEIIQEIETRFWK